MAFVVRVLELTTPNKIRMMNTTRHPGYPSCTKKKTMMTSVVGFKVCNAEKIKMLIVLVSELATHK